MNYHKTSIRQCIITYIIIFGLFGSIVIMLFAYLFGLSVIQKEYTEDYVRATFDSFDSDMALLVRKINMLMFNVSSDSTLLSAVYDGVDDSQADEMQLRFADLLSGYDEIVQLDIITDSDVRYTFLAPECGQQSAISLPTASFLASLSSQKLHLYEYYFLDGNGAPVLVFGRNTPLGSILLYAKESTVSTLYVSHFLSNSTIFLTANGRIVSCSDADFLGMPADLLIKAYNVNNSGSKEYTQSLNLPALKDPLELTYLLSEQDLYQTSNRLIRTLVLLLIVTVFASIFLSFAVSRKLIRNLDALKNNLDLFASDYNYAFRLRKGSEIEELDNHFVQMSEKIRSLFASLEKEKESKRIAELKALQSQINPHFIYNSIDTISWMAKLKKPYEDIEMLSYHFGMFFRLGLHKGDTYITIAEEIQHTRSYLEIEKFRFPDAFSFTEEIDPEVLDCCIIKIVLQPLVENAIHHGFSNIDYKGQIAIRISILPGESEGNDSVLFEVEDNGRGFALTDNVLPHSQRKDGGYALKNVNERLILEYGEESALRFVSAPGEGTVVSFRIAQRKMQRRS